MGWDKGVEYETVYNLILKHMRKASRQKQKCYDSILLIQLRNGLRISEAVRAYIQYIRTKRSELEIPVSKKKKPVARLVIIPGEVAVCEELMSEKEEKLKERVRVYFYSTYKLNTHSLRYSFVTELLKRGVDPSTIAKITKHSKLDYILTYTQEKRAEDVLRDLD